jgi:hypothetical protein
MLANITAGSRRWCRWRTPCCWSTCKIDHSRHPHNIDESGSTPWPNTSDQVNLVAGVPDPSLDLHRSGPMGHGSAAWAAAVDGDAATTAPAPLPARPLRGDAWCRFGVNDAPVGHFDRHSDHIPVAALPTSAPPSRPPRSCAHRTDGYTRRIRPGVVSAEGRPIDGQDGRGAPRRRCRGSCGVEEVRCAHALVKPSVRYPGMRRWSEAARMGVAGSW